MRWGVGTGKPGFYRLRRRDGLRLRPRRGPLGFAEVAGWLAEDLVWVDGWFTSSFHQEVELSFHTEEGWREVVAARFPHSRLDLLEFPGAAGQILVFPAPGLTGDPTFLESLSIRLDGEWFRWAREKMAIRPDLVARLPEKLGTLPEDIEPSFRAFLREVTGSAVRPDDPIFRRHEVVLERLYPGAWNPEAPVSEDPEGLADPLEVESGERGGEEICEESLPGNGHIESGPAPGCVANPPTPNRESLAEAEGARAEELEDSTVSVSEPGPEDDPESSEIFEEEPTEAVRAGLEAVAEAVVSTGPEGNLEEAEPGEIEESFPALGEESHEPEESTPAESAESDPPEEPKRSIFYGGEELPLGICIDDYLIVDDEMAAVHGWVFDHQEQMSHLDWATSDHGPLRLLPGAFRYERSAVVEMYQPFFGRSAAGKHAFIALLRGPAATAPEGFFRLSARDGVEIEVARPDPVYDALQVRDRLWELGRDHLVRRDLLETVLAPCLEILHGQAAERSGISDLFSLGSLVAEPRISIVTPVEGDLDLVEHQLAHLAHEPAMERTELILVLGEAKLTASVERRLHHLSVLYDLPLHLVVTEPESTWARAASLGAAQARGRRLVSLRADVVPAAAGWLEALDHAYTERGAGAGIVGPKLLYHDQTIQHAGFTFARAADFLGSWSEVSRCRGLHRAFPGAEEARRVPALSAACWMVDRELFELFGGFGGIYFSSELEAIDLCLRAFEVGYESWYLPEVEMFRLPEVLSAPAEELSTSEAADREAKRRFDRWRLTHTWGDRIERLMEPSRSPRRSVAVAFRSGRS